MEQIAYVNGSFVPLADAKVSILDRGFLFADGIYEVAAVLDGKLIDNASHLARLERSVGEIQLALPETLARIEEIQKELVTRNNLVNGMVYLEVTRGADTGRDFAFPKGVKPTLIMFTSVEGHHQRAVGQDRHRRHHRARPALDPPRHQERGAAGAGAGQAGGGRSRRRRSLDDRGRQGHRRRLVLGLHPDPGRRDRDAAERQRDPARLHPQGGGGARRRTPAPRRGARRSRSRKRWPPRKPSSPAPPCSCRRWCRSTARRSATASPAR